MNDQEHNLIQAARNGDQAAFGELVQQYQKRQWKQRCCWKSRRRRSGPEQQRKHQRQPESYGERSSFS